MKGNSRLRQLAPLCIAAVALTLAACAGKYPNTTFEPHSELGRAIDFLWDRLLLLGTIVFVLVELALIFVVLRYRRKPTDTGKPPQTHGNAVLEIIWTLIPAFILLFIAVPTVRTIFETQKKAVAGALEIEVIGHQWWWEFRYPEYNIVTANEIYIPTGRTVNFKMTSQDVIHSFWVPQLAGKRDAIANRTNYIWFTPDSSLGASVWNGFCTEYCGSSHAKMRFRVFTVKPDQFASWVAGQQRPAAFGAAANAPAPMVMPFPGGRGDRNPTPPAPRSQRPPRRSRARGPAYTFPQNQAEFDYAKPHTPVPAGPEVHARTHRKCSTRTAGLFIGRMHRMSRDCWKPDVDGSRRTEPHALWISRDNRRGKLPEYSGLSRALDQERAQDEARNPDANSGQGRIRSHAEADGDDGRTR